MACAAMPWHIGTGQLLQMHSMRYPGAVFQHAWPCEQHHSAPASVRGSRLRVVEMNTRRASCPCKASRVLTAAACACVQQHGQDTAVRYKCQDGASAAPESHPLCRLGPGPESVLAAAAEASPPAQLVLVSPAKRVVAAHVAPASAESNEQLPLAADSRCMSCHAE